MIKIVKSKEFANGKVYCLETEDGYPIETTDTFLPYYTKEAINKKTNQLESENLGSRDERWMVGVSVMSGCPVKCKFCATGKLKKYRNLTTYEIVLQVEFIVDSHRGSHSPEKSQEFKINYTRMGDFGLNIDNVKNAIMIIDSKYKHAKIHHYLSTIGINGTDFSIIKNNITLQVSLHSLEEFRRNILIPYKNKMTIKELGLIRTQSELKTTLNLTLVSEEDFNIIKLKEYFDPKYFFIKLSPINSNEISDKFHLGKGIIKAINLY